MRLVICFCLLLGTVYAKDGIIVAVSDRYMEYFIPALAWLRHKINCELPIEVWHAGDELSQHSISAIKQFENIEFHDISDFRNCDPLDCRGFQIKAYILEATEFDRVLLLDADVFVFRDPAFLFSTPEFLETGAFFFRDTDNMRFASEKSLLGRIEAHGTYLKRKKFFHSLIKEPSNCLPTDWRYYWEGPEPSDHNPQLVDFLESGVVAIDKSRHEKGIDEIVKLNEDHKTVYSIIAGDKETFWLGMEIAKEPYTINSERPFRLRGGFRGYRDGGFKISLVHKYNGELVFQQKLPIQIGLHPYLYRTWKGNKPINRNYLSGDGSIRLTKK